MSDPKVFWYVLIPWPKAVYGTLHLTPQYSMNVPSLDPVKGHIHVKVSKRILNNFQNPGQIIRSSVEVPSQISHNFHIPSHSAQPAQATRFLLPNILMTKYQLLKNWNECRNYEFWKPTTRKEQDQSGIIDTPASLFLTTNHFQPDVCRILRSIFDVQVDRWPHVKSGFTSTTFWRNTIRAGGNKGK